MLYEDGVGGTGVLHTSRDSGTGLEEEHRMVGDSFFYADKHIIYETAVIRTSISDLAYLIFYRESVAGADYPRMSEEGQWKHQYVYL